MDLRGRVVRCVECRERVDVVLNSRAKGKRGELQACQVLRELGFEAQRAPDSVGGRGGPDILVRRGETTIRVEVKFGRNVPVVVYRWLLQRVAANDARATLNGAAFLATVGYYMPSWVTRAIRDADWLLVRRVGDGDYGWPWVLIVKEFELCCV